MSNIVAVQVKPEGRVDLFCLTLLRVVDIPASYWSRLHIYRELLDIETLSGSREVAGEGQLAGCDEAEQSIEVNRASNTQTGSSRDNVSE